MKPVLLLALLSLAAGAARAQDEGAPSEPKIRAKAARPESRARREGGPLSPDVDLIDVPTTAVLDYGGYSSRSRFYAQGGLLQYVSFGVYPSLNLGASVAADGLIGDEPRVRMRAPTAQVKYRFFEGDSALPSLAFGYDGQGYRWNAGTKRFNQRQRGFFFVATQEIGVPGFQFHPGFNISDFDSNSIFGALPLSLNIRDRATIMLEWDNINNFKDSRLNAGLRAYLTERFHVDFACRAIGAGGNYSDGAPRGPERIVQLKYSGSF